MSAQPLNAFIEVHLYEDRADILAVKRIANVRKAGDHCQIFMIEDPTNTATAWVVQESIEEVREMLGFSPVTDSVEPGVETAKEVLLFWAKNKDEGNERRIEEIRDFCHALCAEAQIWFPGDVWCPLCKDPT